MVDPLVDPVVDPLDWRRNGSIGDSIAKSISWLEGYTVWAILAAGTLSLFLLTFESFFGEFFERSVASTGAGGGATLTEGTEGTEGTPATDAEEVTLAAESVVDGAVVEAAATEDTEGTAGVGVRNSVFIASFLATWTAVFPLCKQKSYRMLRRKS